MTPPDHGGSRPGAGRKPGSNAYGEPTTPVRIPVSQAPTVLAFLDAYKQEARASDGRPMAQDPPLMPLTAFLSAVPAGFPSPAADYTSEQIDLNQHLIVHGHSEATFILRVTGHSMIGAGIFDGDEVLVDRALTPKEGSVVVAIVNNDLTIKRLIFQGGKPVLRAENPHFADRTFAEGEELSIFGVVTRVLHRV
jgi:DNA polymerase V